MQKELLQNLENLLDVNSDSFEVFLELVKSEVIDSVDVEHLSAITVARDVLQIEVERADDARVVLMALAYPHEPQEVIANLCGVSARTVKRVLARWRSRFVWVDKLADLRRALAPRPRSTPPGGRSKVLFEG